MLTILHLEHKSALIVERELKREVLSFCRFVLLIVVLFCWCIVEFSFVSGLAIVKVKFCLQCLKSSDC